MKQVPQFLIHFNKRFFLVVTLIALGLPLFWLIQLGLEGDLATHDGWEELAGGTFYAIGYTVVISMITSLVWNWVQRTIPWEKGQITKRIITELLATNAVALASMTGLTFLDVTFLNPDHQNPMGIYRTNIQITVIMNLIVVLVFESIGFFRRWKASLVENEQLAKANAISQFQSLKHQLNPHFLFNSLNALSSLVHTDADKAEEFIDEFARVYRYVLEVSDEKLVPLQEELDFIESFVYLHKIRFGEALNYSVQLFDGDDSNYLAPLTLQILIENAIKHNQISKASPLHIHVQTDGHYLWVKNNLMPRDEPEAGTKLGQQNIVQRYGFLIDEEPEFYSEAGQYIAKIPLIRAANEF